MLIGQDLNVKLICMHPDMINWSRQYKIPRSLKDVFTLSDFSTVYDYALYLGTEENLYKSVETKINTASPNTFKKVYFDPLCKYPRYKLSNLTSIKRCLNYNKADSVIISKISFSNPYRRFSYSGEITVFYSTKENTYYVIGSAYSGRNAQFQQQRDAIDILLHKQNYTNTTQDLVRILINVGMLPSDTKFVYNGKYLELSQSTYEFVNNLINKYMLITYDTELDKFVSQNGQPLTLEDLSTLDKMLSSSDPSVVSMGMKLLTNYDLSKHTCAVTVLIYNNRANVNSNQTKNSVGFKQVLQSLNISLYDSKYESINNAYKAATDPNDKAMAKKLVIAHIENELKNIYDGWTKTYSNIPLNINLSIS